MVLEVVCGIAACADYCSISQGALVALDRARSTVSIGSIRIVPRKADCITHVIMQIEIELTAGTKRRRNTSQTVIDAIQTHIQPRESSIWTGIEADPTVVVVRANNLLHTRRTNQGVTSNAGRAVEQRSSSASCAGRIAGRTDQLIAVIVP